MVISQLHQRIILHIIIVLHQRCLNCSECFQRHLMFYTCNYNIRVTHRNGAIKHIFYMNQIHGGIIGRLFFIHFVMLHFACSSSSDSKCYFKSFCMRFEHVIIHTSVSCISSRMPTEITLYCILILLSENITVFDIDITKTQGGQTRLKR